MAVPFMFLALAISTALFRPYSMAQVTGSVIGIRSALTSGYQGHQRGFHKSQRLAMGTRRPKAKLNSIRESHIFCNREDKRWPHFDEFDPTAYYHCTYRGKIERAKCPIINGEARVFDQSTISCRQPMGRLSKWGQARTNSSRLRRQTPIGGNIPPSAAEAQTVGAACRFNTDCVTGAFCQFGVCTCLITHINIDRHCWPKINPGAAGCHYEQQCTAVWPGTTCSYIGRCMCPASYPPVLTRDGTVCAMAGQCPTNSYHSRLHSAMSGRETVCQAKNGEILAGDCDGYGDIYLCIHGFCCPSRALTCIQPVDSGKASSGSAETRFFFNSITRTCQRFTYFGGGGNANNFQTAQHCETYCLLACARGNPEYITLKREDESVKRCSNAGAGLGNCSPSFRCQTTNSGEPMCCPTRGFICSNRGGLTAESAPALPYSLGTPVSPSAPPTTRYYWDVARKKCLSFPFRGQQGNYNNFATEAECMGFCSATLCIRGEPLTSNLNEAIDCAGAEQKCPGTHFCSGGACCPTRQTVCTQPKSVGTCSSYAQRFWYNAVRGICEVFTFSGCNGNANRFGTHSECSSYCRDIRAEPMCVHGTAYKDQNTGLFRSCGSENFLPGQQDCPANYECYFDGFVYGCCPSRLFCLSNPDPGIVCITQTPSNRWYFSPAKGACLSFAYSGCDGNANNFAVQRDCEEFCRIGGCPDGGRPIANRTCATPSSDACPTSHYCVQVETAMTVGHQPTTRKMCCPTKATVCAQPQSEGTVCGVGTFSRFYYDTSLGTCKMFNFLGCGGNRNNFATAQQCVNYCSSAVCPSGKTIYRSGENDRAQTCSPGVAKSCPEGYVCHFDEISSTYVCCGTPDTGACMYGEIPFVDAIIQAPWQCSPNIPGGCPVGYHCRFSSNRNLYYCCVAASLEGVCPMGSSGFIEPLTNQIRACTLNGGDVCPETHFCREAAHGATFGYCCTKLVAEVNGPPMPSPPNDFCTTGTPYLVGYNQPVVCFYGGENTCPSPFVCKENELHKTAYCCTRTHLDINEQQPVVRHTSSVPQATCSSGMPLWTAVPGVAQVCNPLGSVGNGDCPIGYTCEPTRSSTEGICCSISIQHRTAAAAAADVLPPAAEITEEDYGAGESPDADEMPQAVPSCPTGTLPPPTADDLPPTCAGLNVPDECPVGYRCVEQKLEASELIFEGAHRKICCSIPHEGLPAKGAGREKNMPLVETTVAPNRLTCPFTMVPAAYRALSVGDEPILQACIPGLYNGCPENAHCLESVGAHGYLCCTEGQDELPEPNVPSFGSENEEDYDDPTSDYAADSGADGEVIRHINRTVISATNSQKQQVIPMTVSTSKGDNSTTKQRPHRKFVNRPQVAAVVAGLAASNQSNHCPDGQIFSSRGFCLSKLRPGQIGCIDDVQCKYSPKLPRHSQSLLATFCNLRTLRCMCGTKQKPQLIFNNTCVLNCPRGFVLIDGACVSVDIIAERPRR